MIGNKSNANGMGFSGRRCILSLIIAFPSVPLQTLYGETSTRNVEETTMQATTEFMSNNISFAPHQ
jgi:hypothetical protein